MNANYYIVYRAIANRLWVIATYQGHRRWLCPHVLGHKRGRAQCLFYQFDGTSESGLGPVGSPRNWRCIPVDEMKNVTTAEGLWFTAPNHSRPQTCVDRIDAEVDF